MRRYLWLPLLGTLLALVAGYLWVEWSKGGEGSGLYSRLWQPEPVFAYWAPERFYASVDSLDARFEGGQCITCHESVTPGIVLDWRDSAHASPKSGEPVQCDACHGNDHADLHLPSPAVCGECHADQHEQFLDERRFGFPSHALAMERVLDAKHFVDKPKGEVSACVQCHSVATKCDSCHTRHRFSAAEARRPEACITCHSGPPHPDDETYFASAHGQRYLAEGAGWDWSKPLTRGSYPVPTCAYCHMERGSHQVADKAIWKFGLKEVNPLTSSNQVKRERWVALCADCHEEAESREWLSELDRERKGAWSQLYAAESILKGLRGDDLLHPAADERPPYPLDSPGGLWSRARIGFFEGQASAFYNVSGIERDYFEMWYFDNLRGYKSAAHGDDAGVRAAHRRLAEDLAAIEVRALELRALGERERAATGARADPGDLWTRGAYTEYNREHN